MFTSVAAAASSSSRATTAAPASTAPPIPIAADTVKKSVLGVDKFVQIYYQLLDTHHKRATLPALYTAGSTAAVLWNGNAMLGGSPQFQQFLLEKLPPTVHDIQSYDCQPLGNGTGLLVTVSGSVKYGGAGSKTTPHLISHQFVLVDDPAKPGTYFIASDCLRFV